MDITWKHNGDRMGELDRLNRDRNDYTKHPFTRLQADRAHRAIVEQLNDKKLCGLRDRLRKAALANDERELVKIQQAIRAHLGEDRETGSYEQ